jgi:hypothetical protein
MPQTQKQDQNDIQNTKRRIYVCPYAGMRKLERKVQRCQRCKAIPRLHSVPVLSEYSFKKLRDEQWARMEDLKISRQINTIQSFRVNSRVTGC